MADTIKLKELANLIRYASSSGENTAERVGRLLVGILDTIDAEELAKVFLRRDKGEQTSYLMKLLGGAEIADGLTVDSIIASELAKLKKGLTVTGGADIDYLRVLETISAKLIDAVKVDATDVNATNSVNAKTVTASEKATTLNLLVQALASTYDLHVSHVATMMRTIIKDYVSSEAFTPGLTGEGFKISKAINGDWNLEIDNIVVRKVMTIFEMVISKVRSVNGGLVISPANGRIKSVSETTGSPAYCVLGIEGDMQFVVDDFVRCQVFNGGQAKYYWVRVASVSGDSILVLKSEFANGAVPAVGDDLVQMGNKTNTARQGVIYLTASEDGKPRISVLDGVNSTSTVGKNKVILGCLDGITDADFPADFQPSGYGLYAMNVFLKGIFVLRSGKSVESEFETVRNALTTLSQEFSVAMGEFTSKITEVKEYADGKVDGVIFGSRNLLIDSGVEFGAANYNLGNKMYSPFERKKGKQYTITMCYTLGDNNSNITAYEASGSYGAASFSTRGSRVIESKTFTPVHPDWGIGSQSMGFYQFPNDQFGSKIHWVTIVEGNKGLSAFTPAPEDVTADAQAKANDAKQAAINDAVGKYPTKTEFSTSITQLSNSISLKVSQNDFNALGRRVGSAESAIVQQATQISAQVTKVNDLTGRVASAELALNPDNIWLGIKSNVDASISLYKTQVDARLLDPNKYYLVTISMATTVPYTITVERTLSGNYGVPPYSAHASGFTVICKWQSNGSGWGGSNIKRIIQTLEYRFVGSCPVGSIGQILESSQEYVYVRGGSIYNIRVEGTSSTTVVLHTSDHFPYPAYPDIRRPSPIDSVVTPIVDLDQKVTEEQVKTGISIAPGIINVFGKQISLAGAVTFSSMASDAQGKINDAQNAANAAGAAAGAAKNTADKAITDAANSLVTSRNNIAAQLGYGSYDAMSAAAIAGKTIINGGMIRTELLDARAIVTGVLAATDVTATNLTVTGNSKIGGMSIVNNKLTGNSIEITNDAIIGGFKVSSYGLTNNGNNDAYIYIDVNSGGSKRSAAIGNRLPSVSGIDSASLFMASGAGENRAMIISATGSTTNHKVFGGKANLAIEATGGIAWKMNQADHWCMPGLIKAVTYYNSWSSISRTQEWGHGCMLGQLTRASDQIFRLNHDIGHTDYYISVMPYLPNINNQWWNSIPSIVGVNADRVEFQFRTDGGGETSPLRFTVLFFGRPGINS